MEQVYHSLSNASTEIASVLAEMSNTASNIKKYVKKRHDENIFRSPMATVQHFGMFDKQGGLQHRNVH